MIELELTRSPTDRRLYVLERAGTLRLEGLFSGNAIAGARPASIARRRRAVCVSRPRLRPAGALSPRPRPGRGRRCHA